MTFEYDEFADVLWVAISEPVSSCVYVESDSFGVLLRVEETTGIIRGFQISAWSRRIAKGHVLIPEIENTEFVKEWLAKAKSLDRLGQEPR